MVSLQESLIEWVKKSKDVKIATIFGSQARTLQKELHGADRWSDIDIEIVTTSPSSYVNRDWTKLIQGQQTYAYAVRPVFGGVQKVTALFSGGEVDFIIISYWRLLIGRLFFRLGLHRYIKAISKSLGEFALVMSFGHKVVKGSASWEQFYADVIKGVQLAHLTDAEAISLADGAYVDGVSVLAKVNRGELVAAQRWFHRSIIETNLRLLHELRLRKGLVSYPDGRRIEQLLSEYEISDVKFEIRLNESELRASVLMAIKSTRRLLIELTGITPPWPSLR